MIISGVEHFQNICFVYSFFQHPGGEQVILEQGGTVVFIFLHTN